VSASDDDTTSATVGFQANILPMFTEMDISHMGRGGVSLNSYPYMSNPDNAQKVYDQVSSGAMPPGDSGEDPWSPAQVALFQQWMQGGYQP
jgi:hypothetical protein